MALKLNEQTNAEMENAPEAAPRPFHGGAQSFKGGRLKSAPVSVSDAREGGERREDGVMTLDIDIPNSCSIMSWCRPNCAGRRLPASR